MNARQAENAADVAPGTTSPLSGQQQQVQDDNIGITRMDNNGIARKIKRAAAAQTAALCPDINVGGG